ncbi:hypothetical protein [Streptomyces sp. NPDC001719]
MSTSNVVQSKAVPPRIGSADLSDIRRAGWIGLGAVGTAGVSCAFTFDPATFPNIWPRSDWTTAAIQEWFIDHRTQAIVQTFCIAVGLYLAIWFTAGFAVLMERRGGRRSVATRTLTPAMVCLAGVMEISQMPWALIGLTGTPGYPPAEFFPRYSWAFALITFYFGQLGLGLFLSAAAVAMRDAGLPSTWIRATVALAVLEVVGSLGFMITKGPMSQGSLIIMAPYFLWQVWIGAVAVNMIRTPGPASPST